MNFNSRNIYICLHILYVSFSFPLFTSFSVGLINKIKIISDELNEEKKKVDKLKQEKEKEVQMAREEGIIIIIIILGINIQFFR